MKKARWSSAIVLAMALGACSDSTDSSQSTESAASSNEGGRPAAVSGKSFDLIQGEKIDLLEYAVRKLTGSCLKDAGYPQMANVGVQRQNGTEMMFVLDGGRFRGFTSEKQARERGFGSVYPAEPARLVSYDKNFDKKLEECTDEANEKLGEDSRKTIEAYNEVANQVAGEFAVFLRKRVPSDIPALADCLEKEGFPLRDREAFLKMWDVKHFGIKLGANKKIDQWAPSPAKGGVQIGPPVAERPYTPSPQEAELAAAWYRCDAASGRVEKLLKDANATAAEITARNEDKLAELNPKIEDLAKKAADLVGSA
ncbi:hypothetical protein [Actinoplanes sp. NPDC049802]|uniref:hypothetical protein n=1 Tax=Actinoplanes sp. NPDC049802 TaxID=3154742 RepID=UPI0033C3981D